MPAQHLYYDIRGHLFLSEEEALLLVRSELDKGNLHTMTDRMIEYGFPPHERADVMKICVRVDRLESSGQSQKRVFYFHRLSGQFVSHDKVRELMIEALKENNLDLMTDRTVGYGFVPGIGCLRETKYVKISVVVE